MSGYCKAAKLESSSPAWFEKRRPVPAAPGVDSLLDGMVRDRLRPIAVALCLLYVAIAAGHAVLLPRPLAAILTPLALASALLFGAYAIYSYRSLAPPGWAHPLAAGAAGIALVNSVVHLHLSREPLQTTNIALVILGCGLVFLSFPWLLGVISVSVASWAGIVWVHPPVEPWIHFGFMLLSATAISVVAQAASIRGVERLASVEGRAHEMALRLDAEEALRKSRLRNEQLVNAIPDLIFRMDSNGRYLDYHARDEDELYAQPSEFLGRLVEEVTPPEHAASIRNHLRRAVETRQTQIFEYELSLLGSIRYYECRMVYCEGGEVLAFCRDISERKRSERELISAERRYRALVERVPAIIYTRGVQQPADDRYISPQISVLGYSQSEWLADPDFWMTRLHSADRERVLDQFHRSRNSFEPFLAEYRILDSEDRLHWIRDEATLVRGDDGTPLYWQGVAIDITQGKIEAARAQELQAEMQHAEKLKSLGLLVGGIAHDFNNLLVGILGNAELALETMEHDHPARAGIQEIHLAGERAADLTRQMLAYAGKGRVRVETVDLSAVLNGMRPLVESAVSKKAVIRYNLPHDAALIDADITQIRQVILNILINASEALNGAAGEITVTIGFVDTNQDPGAQGVFGSTLPSGNYVSLEFVDHGCGMSKETAARIFEPFYTTKFAGRGLGLSAVRGIVEGHGGAISVESAPGQGSTFRILFPRSGAGPDAICSSELAPPPRAASAEGGAILVVDDEEVVRSVSRETLENAGFAVLFATGGEQAVRIFVAAHEEIRAVLLDLTMPDLDGAQSYREIRKLSGDVPVVLMSGYSPDSAAEELIAEGVPFIKKPFGSRMLLNCVLDAMEQCQVPSPSPCSGEISPESARSGS